MEIINPNKFAKISDVIFSEVISEEEFLIKNSANELIVLSSSIVDSEKFIWYVSKQIVIKENDIIFCQTELVTELFKLLKKENRFSNLTLITHQSDKAITRKLFLQKPDSIKRWFGTNVKYRNQLVSAIPIGVNNNYMKNYPIEIDFKHLKNLHFKDKKDSVYLNFNINTRFLQRFHLKYKFMNIQNFNVDENNLTKEQYLDELNNHKYVACPWGNGLDTHRLWETLYSNSLPILKNHLAFRQFDDLPILFVSSFRSLDYKNLEQSSYDVNLSNTSADFQYWKNLILTQNSEVIDKSSIKLNLKINEKQVLKSFFRRRKMKQRYKKFKYFIFRLYKLTFRLLIYRKV
jgi:hypothetical protein